MIQTSLFMYTPSNWMLTILFAVFLGIVNVLRYQPMPVGRYPPPPPVGASLSKANIGSESGDTSSAKLQNATLADSDSLGGNATGTINFTNGKDGALVKGDLTIPRAN